MMRHFRSHNKLKKNDDQTNTHSHDQDRAFMIHRKVLRTYSIVTFPVFIIYLTQTSDIWIYSIFKSLPDWLSLPCIIDYIRIPYVIMAYYVANNYPHSVVNILGVLLLLITWGLFDAVDGELARSQNAMTPFGHWLDWKMYDLTTPWIYYIGAWTFYPKQNILFQLTTIYRLTEGAVFGHQIYHIQLARNTPTYISIFLIIFKAFSVKFVGKITKMEPVVVGVAMCVIILMHAPRCIV